RPISCLTRAERTGCRIFSWVWSYVVVRTGNKHDNDTIAILRAPMPLIWIFHPNIQDKMKKHFMYSKHYGHNIILCQCK
ncbi:hypothetical protein B0T21DRAFT_281664, partial [Apiosordaria backusii]